VAREFQSIGTQPRRTDALGKVTGRARFAADLSAARMLHGFVLLGRKAHARILSIDSAAARAAPGVRAILTAADLPAARTFGGVIKNQPVLADERVRYYGDGVALVAAETPEAGRAALRQIAVAYQELPAVTDPQAALTAGAPILHPNAPTDPPVAGDVRNLCARHRVQKGDVTAALARSDVVLERTYRTQSIEHAYLEPEAVLVEETEDGGLRVTGSIQNIFSTRRALGEIFALDLARVTVKQATLGGSFGGKDDVMTQMAARAALLARATHRPVKMVYTREESMQISYKRHPYVLDYRIGATRDGRLTGLAVRMVADAGAYASMSPFVTWRSTVQATGPYEVPHAEVEVLAAYTNNVYTGAMRGFGSPQVNFAIEALIDELASELGCDPLELRRKNMFREGSVTVTGQKLPPVVSLPQVLEIAARRCEWPVRRAQIARENEARTDGKRRGLGLACSYRGVSLGAEGVDAVGAIVSVQTDGSVIVTLGLTDMGQGVSTAVALIAAEVLGIGVDRIKTMNVHTGRVPDSGPTVASRSTIMGGQATKKGAEAVREVLIAVAADMLGAPAGALRCRAGRIQAADGSAEGAPAECAITDVVARAYELGRPLLGFGWHPAPETSWDGTRGRGQAYFTFVYGANIAEVEVDTKTGKVDLLRMTAVHDVGRAIAPAMVRSQIYGGVAMGIGYALLEEYASEQGHPRTHNFDEYLLPTCLDMPAVDVTIVENPDPAGPFGAKSIGEPATEIAAPAIINAIAHATGRRIRRLPADLETVLLGHPLQRPARRAQALRPREERSCRR